MTAKLDKMPVYDKKRTKLDPKYQEQPFTLKMNLLDDDMYNFLAFVRFLVFNDEVTLDAFCAVAAQRAVQWQEEEMQKKQTNELLGHIDSSGAKPTADFKGWLDPISAQIEE